MSLFHLFTFLKISYV